MKYIQLNNTELNISPICLGTAGFGDKTDQAPGIYMPEDMISVILTV